MDASDPGMEQHAAAAVHMDALRKELHDALSQMANHKVEFTQMEGTIELQHQVLVWSLGLYNPSLASMSTMGSVLFIPPTSPPGELKVTGYHPLSLVDQVRQPHQFSGWNTSCGLWDAQGVDKQRFAQTAGSSGERRCIGHWCAQR